MFQTDLHVFESYGFAGVLVNENMNYANASESSPHYHQSTDVVANIDFEFSSTVAHVAIETVLRLANEPEHD